MPFNVGVGEMVLVFLIVLLLTGARRLPEIGAGLGREVARFKAAYGATEYGEAVRTLLARARTEAVRLQHQQVGTEHVMLALTLEPDSATELVLRSFGVPLEQLRWRLKESLVVGASQVDADVPYGGPARRVIELAMSEAKGLGHQRVDPVHVLLALLQHPDQAGQALASLGLSLERARAEARRALS
jgi:ATP-dependent Clp protease ATP-binding subunit ClpC